MPACQAVPMTRSRWPRRWAPPGPWPRIPRADPRFQPVPPGSIVAGRYRLVAMLGKGGMGEVYRADDLTLDQPVALKFLPENVAADPERLAEFHNELRVARQVTHKNVCRLYDLGEFEGRRFLTMQYVDGEDLKSLLRRIGRVPEDKALQLARQLCAGLAAAHEQGVVHRDLKPANVLIDGDGHALITDFGLAVPASDTTSKLAGTPHYMAPEQFSGEPASVKSDLYALGLVLFELFTGRRAHDADTIDQLRHLHESGTVTTPSSVLHDIDPGVERVVLRCLERNPARRPASALAVSAALPGARSAGGGARGWRNAVAGHARRRGRGRRAAGGVRARRDRVCGRGGDCRGDAGATRDGGPARSARTSGAPAGRSRRIRSSRRWATRGRAATWPTASRNRRTIEAGWPGMHTDPSVGGRSPPAIRSRFSSGYRTSPRPLVPQSGGRRPTFADPPLTLTDSRRLVLDTRGRLISFQTVPADFDPTETGRRPGGKPLFDAAGLSATAFQSVTPQWTPATFADTRAAWEGTLPDRPDDPRASRSRRVSRTSRVLLHRLAVDELDAIGTTPRRPDRSVLDVDFIVSATLL